MDFIIISAMACFVIMLSKIQLFATFSNTIIGGDKNAE